LRQGLHGHGANHIVQTLDTLRSDLDQACKYVVLTGYSQGIQAARKVFFEAFGGPIHYVIIHRARLTEQGQPSVDDAFQQTRLCLHQRLRKGACIERPLRSYVATVTTNTCSQLLRDNRRHLTARDVETHTKIADGYVPVPSTIIEFWEDWDIKLGRKDQDNTISCIILGHQCLDSWSTENGTSADGLMAQWQRLASLTEKQIYHLHDQSCRWRERSRETDPVRLAAELINAGLLAAHQMAVGVATGAGLDPGQCCKLVAQLSNLSANALYARLCRIEVVLGSPA